MVHKQVLLHIVVSKLCLFNYSYYEEACLNELVISIVTIIHKTADLHHQLEDILRLQYLIPDAFFTPAISDVDP